MCFDVTVFVFADERRRTRQPSRSTGHLSHGGSGHPSGCHAAIRRQENEQ